MLRLKTILHSKILYIILILIILIELPIYINKKSIYDISDNTFICTLDSYYVNDNKIDIDLSCKEKLIGYIYYNNKEYVDDFKETYNLKDKIQVTGILEEINGPTNINACNYKDYYKIRGIYYRLKINNIEKIDNYNKIYYLYNYFFNKINKLKSKDYIYSLVFGNKKYLEDNTLDMYKKIGIMHMFSVSGMHISIIVELLNRLLKKEKNSKNIIVLIILFLYYLLVHTISLERALLSYIITYINNKYDLEINKYLKVLLIIIIILVINPLYMFDSSFYLSIITGSALIIYSDKLNSKNIIVDTIKISIFSFLITFPLITYIYNEINILSFIFNIITSLIITNIIFPLSIITIFVGFTDSLLYIIINLFESIISFLSSFSINLIFKKEIIFIFIYYIIIYLIFKNRKYIILLIVTIVIHYNINYIFPGTYLYFFDVGQGDSILVNVNSNYFLVDTGGNTSDKYYYGEKVIIPTLKSLGINHIDKLIITHGDKDHGKEALPIINNFRVDELYINNNEINELETELIDTGIKYNTISSKKIKINDNYVFLYSFIGDDENDSSIITYMKIGEIKVLLTGDISVNTEDRLLSNYDIKNIDILKVAHHGSKTSSSKSFIKTINPKYSVISVGKNNRYGHPNKEVLDNLKKSTIYRTDNSGGIMIRLDNNKLKIDTYSSVI